MLSKITSAAVVGVQAQPVHVEVMLVAGAGGFSTVGLPEMSVREGRVRVRAAIRESELPFPRRSITVNLAPADLRKDGTYFDLPVALGILECEGAIPKGSLRGWVAAGELSLSGAIRPVRGLLAVAEMARASGLRGVICAAQNAAEVAAVSGIEVRAAGSLLEVVEALGGGDWPEAAPLPLADDHSDALCWSEVRGQAHAKRALEVAAAGGHNIVMTGSPGCGKTMLARRLPSILPPLDDAAALEVTKIYSVAGLLPAGVGLVRKRPFRAPHHTGSATSLVGGGSFPRPGEVSLAHHGVLFMDELPEFPRSVLETLRQPLEDGEVTVARARTVARFPSRAMLVAALNPCPCGYLGSRRRACVCSDVEIRRYAARLSGPLLDRIDVQIELEALPTDMLRSATPGVSSAEVRERVIRARARQQGRFGSSTATNASVSMRQLRTAMPLAAEVHDVVLKAIDVLGLSPRAHDRIWRVAASIADLDGATAIRVAHVSEALEYRHFDRPATEPQGNTGFSTAPWGA